nr:RNA-directed DNA polymerase, eukaryota, reverse transcriptase zinc-binding domain protein [Tanacetum cinerariifolium]
TKSDADASMLLDDLALRDKQEFETAIGLLVQLLSGRLGVATVTNVGTKPSPVMVIFSFKGPNIITPDILKVSDVNEVCKKAERFGLVYNVQGPDAFNLFISNAGSEENPLEVEKLQALEAAQKAKIKWAIEGNKNSKYYHGIPNKKRSQLAIRGILIDSMWTDSPCSVKSEFLSHFKKRFEQPQAFRLQIDTNFPNQLTLEQQVNLENDVSKDEIKRADWDYGTDKSPGQDRVNDLGGNHDCLGQGITDNGEIKDCLDQDIGDNGKRNVECEKSANKSDDSASKSVYQDKADKIAEKESNANMGSNRGVWNMSFADIMNANKIDNKLVETSTEISENGNEVVVLNDEMIEMKEKLEKGLKKEIEVVYKGIINHEKFTKIIKVEYAWKPPCCDKCQAFTVVKNRKVIYEKEKQNKSYNKWNGYNGVYIYKRCYGTQNSVKKSNSVVNKVDVSTSNRYTLLNELVGDEDLIPSIEQRKIVDNYMNKENEGVNIDKQRWSNETKRYYKDMKELFDAAKEWKSKRMWRIKFRKKKNLKKCQNGSFVLTNEMNEFLDCTKEIEVDDILSSGFHFTWTKSRGNPKCKTLKKLDKIMINQAFMEKFPISHGIFLPYLISDHSLAVLKLPNGMMKKRKAFSDEAQRIGRGVCEVEIKNAIFDIGDSKTPGPDGFTARFYKIKGVLGKLVNESQSAFIAGRQITDNILLAQELFKGYNTKQKLKRVIFKIDLQKAYDTIDWSFFKVILEQFGFPGKMVNWIMVCVSTTKFSININGGKEGYFSRVSTIKEALEEFSSYSGLKANMNKSTMFFRGMIIAEQNVILDIIPFAIGRLLVSFKNLKGKSIWEVSAKVNSSVGWKEILKLRDKIRKHVLWKIRDGTSVNAWYDNWRIACPLCETVTTREVYEAGMNINTTVADLTVIKNGK